MRLGAPLAAALLFVSSTAHADEDADRLTSRATVGVHLAATRAEISALRNDVRRDFTTTGLGPILHMEGSLVGLFKPGSGAFYIRDWSIIDLGVGAIRGGDEFTNDYWIYYKLDLGLRAVARVNEDMELTGRISYGGVGDPARDRGGRALQLGGGRDGITLIGGGRLQQLYGEAGLGWGSDSGHLKYKLFMIGGAYRYGEGMFCAIGARLEYVRGEVASDGQRTNELHARLTWGGF